MWGSIGRCGEYKVEYWGTWGVLGDMESTEGHGSTGGHGEYWET